MTEHGTPAIDSGRLWQSLNDISQFGATPAGGLHRLAASAEDGQARDFVVAAARAIGCTIRIDALGNTFVRRAGTDSQAKAILIGSHLDSQPLGGKYDGIFGVMAGLEVLRALHASNSSTQHSIEVAVWTNEEGARFSPAMMGAAFFAGKFTAEELHSRVDVDGVTLGESLNAIGYHGNDVVSPDEYACYLEIHIEQGPILERDNIDIGVVTAVQGMRWFRVHLSGQSGHSGTYPMEGRKDALTASAEVVTGVQRIGLDQPNIGRATVGHLLVTPNSPNVVPGHVELMVEFRHPDVAVLDVMTAQLYSLLKDVEARTDVAVQVNQELDSATINFDPRIIDTVEKAAESTGLTSRRMISGAGHDACQVNGLMPSGMIFIPCVDGISHAENEDITQEWATNGAQVMLQSVLEIDSRLSSEII
jgi:N-carbamoyl-L-amino-acid hydrolase